MVSVVGARAYKDLSRPQAWAYWKDLYFSSSMTSSLMTNADPDGSGRRRSALVISGTIGAAAASWFRDRLDEAHLVAGDADSGRKRDDIAKQLDPQSLAAARLAIQTFTPEPQPDDAINVASPAGGWDSAPAQASTAKPAAKPVSIKRAAARG